MNTELNQDSLLQTFANLDLASLLDSTGMVIISLDRDFRLRAFTRAARNYYDIGQGDLGRSINDLGARFDYPQLYADAERVAETLEPVERELRIEASGETILLRLVPRQNSHGRMEGYTLVFMDITQRARREAELARRYSELENLYDTLPVGLCVVDRDYRYTRINPHLARINGLTVEENLGRTVDEALPGMIETAKSPYIEVFETGEPLNGVELEGEVPSAPGVRRIWVGDYYPIRDGSTVYAVAACLREVTNEQRFLNQIAESEDRIRRVFDVAPLHIATTEGPDHVVTYLNPAAARPVGGMWLVGKSFRKAMPEYDEQGFFADWDHVYKTGEPLRMPETYSETTHPETGEVYRAWHSQWLEPLRDADGHVTGVTTFSYDITDMVEAREAARASEREKTLLLAELQHRVKNSLATIRAISRLLLSGSEYAETYQSRLSNRLEAMSRTHDLLFGEKIVSASIGSLLEVQAAPYQTAENPRIHVNGPDCSLSAEEATSVGMALHELLTNAAKYGALSVPEGHIEITCERDSATHCQKLIWREMNGPPVEEPDGKEGFGSIVIQRLLASTLDAEVDMEFHADGLRLSVTWTEKGSEE